MRKSSDPNITLTSGFKDKIIFDEAQSIIIINAYN